MRILENGLIEIENVETGEKRQVKPEELGSYSPFLANQYANAMGTLKTQAETAKLNQKEPAIGTFFNETPTGTQSQAQGTQQEIDLSGFVKDTEQPQTEQPKQPWDVSFSGNKILPGGLLSRENEMPKLQSTIDEELLKRIKFGTGTTSFAPGTNLGNIKL